MKGEPTTSARITHIEEFTFSLTLDRIQRWVGEAPGRAARDAGAVEESALQQTSRLQLSHLLEKGTTQNVSSSYAKYTR